MNREGIDDDGRVGVKGKVNLAGHGANYTASVVVCTNCGSGREFARVIVFHEQHVRSLDLNSVGSRCFRSSRMKL